ncbi:glycerophosphodiester phosphodiesterase family protein [Bacillus sp. JJ1609]|uniref:glycerophosphodiester phosphodiesterase family protein n=1 Tax=Bacillus sp. JJ1609 TaxID=3122977 RepID=UPI0030008324
MKFFKSKLLIFLTIIGLFIFLNNTNLFSAKNREPLLLAHRGVAQTFKIEGITGDTCTAERIHKPKHAFLENTIPSMEAAFEAGANIVELDVHPTTDGEFVVFHDWTLDCRTNGEGVTREHSLAELKELDIGYGYTADEGKTYPFRGKGVGMMPTLDEVLKTFAGKELLIHVKSNDPEEGTELANYLLDYPENTLEHISVYGGDQPVAALKAKLPNMRVMSKESLKSCLLPYIAVGWTGYVPSACTNTQLHIPEKIGPWLWGWPEKFVGRMDKNNARTIIVGGNGRDFSTGFDTIEDLERLPEGFSGVIWTNKIQNIAPKVRNDH